MNNQQSYDPISMFQSANEQYNNFLSQEEQLIADINSNTYVYPHNNENTEFDGVGLLMGLVFSKLEKAIFYVDVTSGFGQNQLQNNFDHFAVALELISPYTKIVVYSVGASIKHIYSGLAKDVSIKYIFTKFIEDSYASISSGQLLINHMTRGNYSNVTQIFIITKAIHVNQHTKYDNSLPPQVKLLVISTKRVNQKISSQILSQSKQSYFNYVKLIQSQINSSVSGFAFLLNSPFIDLFQEQIGMNGNAQYLQTLRSRIIQKLEIYVQNEVQLSPQTVSTSALNRQKVVYYVLPIIIDNKLAGIAARSVSIQQIHEIIVTGQLEYLTANVFFIPEQYQKHNTNIELQVKLRKYGEKWTKNKFNSFITQNCQRNYAMQDYVVLNNQIFLNIQTLQKLNEKTTKQGLSNINAVEKFLKDTVQFSTKQKFIKTIDTSYSEEKYIFSDHSTNQTKQLLYIGEQGFIDDNQYMILFKIKYERHNLLQYDNCTLFKQVMNTNKCLNSYDDQIIVKIAFQSLNFYQNQNIVNPYILNQANTVFQELQSLKIKDVLQLSDSNNNISATLEYKLLLPISGIYVQISQQLLYQIKFQRLMYFIAQENIAYSNIKTEGVCIFSQYNQMFVCKNQINQNKQIEIFDANLQKYQRFDFSNKQWAIQHQTDEFPSNCFASWLLVNKMQTSKQLLTHSYHLTGSSLAYSKYSEVKSLVLSNPLTEPFNYAPYAFMEQIYDKKVLELNIFSTDQEFILDMGAYIVINSEQFSKKQEQVILNPFNLLDTRICQQFGVSQSMVDTLFRAGVLQISYVITAGKYCLRFSISSATTTKYFTIDGVDFKLDKIGDSLLYKLQILTPNQYNYFQDITHLMCFSSMESLNKYLFQYLTKHKFKFEMSNTEMYQFTNSYLLSQSSFEDTFNTEQNYIDVDNRSITALLYLVIFILIIYYVVFNSHL
ncbi:Conserved_hypothetical protein [Hexamita inflata]|uniref:Transmembrane protein n=1 Tax=Hexamita inflata TaxID=28002 RepID=A0AA86URP5_9EUKA|nr:Conserved hypothetical protein [Hexamita inflata]